ncbi:hypothetical protein SUGI_1120600 [Cryptomeria japonica]|uniref:glucan endo-1,3-alpha-glucosidase agn1 n=1 Tax=Cryptomeria japonica TaxID=3369 RepID=UPI0024148D1A|nr:glucan endo-1,3-alpha-glucosidase agn1 [Cryptomeria japonica]GLJ52649.1 hypothetical protein SUGI_1120600 [Cryptomeria japonica]
METKAFLLILLLSCNLLFSRAAEQRMVFAHYLLYQPETIETLKKEIQLAQSKGIDGFALNSNEWREARADDMYEAAKQVGSSFKLFFSADIHKDSNGNLTPDQLVAMLSSKYTSHPNQMKYQDRPLFSSWLGSNDSWWKEYNYASALDGWKDVFQKAGGKQNFSFIPFFPTDGSYWGVRGTAENYTDVIDGLYTWETSAWPYLDSDKQNPSDSLDRNYLNASNFLGKVYMASPSPWFFKECEVKGNYQGPGLWITRWEQLIKLSPPLLEIVTWNDWVESSYVAPSLSSSTDAANVADFTHRAFLELGQYYISWYKSGSAPAITQDSIYLFYYTHSKTVVLSGSLCQVSDFSALSDKVYVTAMLTAPASVQLQSGSSSQTFNAQAGISTWSMDFQEGQQTAVLSRDGKELSKLVGSKSISNSNVQKYNFNVYSTCTTCT